MSDDLTAHPLRRSTMKQEQTIATEANFTKAVYEGAVALHIKNFLETPYRLSVTPDDAYWAVRYGNEETLEIVIHTQWPWGLWNVEGKDGTTWGSKGG